MKDTAQGARLSRRTVLVALGAGLGVTAAGAAPAVAPRPRRSARNLERGTIADWSAFVGERFDVAGGGSLRLVSVEQLCSGGPTPSARTCFAAVFEAIGAGAPAGERTYALAPAGAPPVPLHLGARAEVRGRSRLVAVFN